METSTASSAGSSIGWQCHMDFACLFVEIEPEQVSLSLFQVCRPQVFVPMTLEYHKPINVISWAPSINDASGTKQSFSFFSAETVICSSAELNCEGHFCIRQSWKCDKSVDCFDQSDEDACGNYSRCHTKFFLLFFRCVFAHDSQSCSKYNAVSVSNKTKEKMISRYLKSI